MHSQQGVTNNICSNPAIRLPQTAKMNTSLDVKELTAEAPICSYVYREHKFIEIFNEKGLGAVPSQTLA